MKVIQFRNIKKEKRFCCKCGKPISGRGWFYIYSPERGKYLCRLCEIKIEE